MTERIVVVLEYVTEPNAGPAPLAEIMADLQGRLQPTEAELAGVTFVSAYAAIREAADAIIAVFPPPPIAAPVPPFRNLDL